ncbi:MAG: nucleotidyltransferase family protein [Candidatus Zipacnadales bacterium]
MTSRHDYQNGVANYPASASFTPGLAFLCGCVRGESADCLAKLLLAALQGGEIVDALAARHGLAPLVHRQLKDAMLEQPRWSELSQRLARTSELILSQQAFLLAAGAELVGAFRSSGLSCIFPVKGLALAALCWPRPLLRAMDDVDLLIPEAQLTYAERVAREAGFIPVAVPVPETHHHGPLLRRGIVLIELHWALWTPTTLPIPHPDLQEITKHTVTGHLGKESLPVPSVEALFFLAAGALARERFDVPLHAWADLYWLLTDPMFGVNVSVLLDRAQELGLRSFTELMIRLTFWLVGKGAQDLPESNSAVREAERRLRPIVLRRLREGTCRSDRHALLLQATRHTGEVVQVPGKRRPQTRQGQTRTSGLNTLKKAVRYAGGLARSRRQRMELREEWVIRRVLESLGHPERTR